MNKITFMVKGSSPEPYQVSFVLRSQTNLSAYCTCPAGQNGQFCKHRIGILTGTCENIVSDNRDDMKIVQGWMKGTDVESALIEVFEIEKEYEIAKKRLSEAKKQLARSMRE